MKALLLAAGFGTRLKPFTFFQAKASLPLLGVPFIHYALRFLESNELSGCIINLHSHPDSVKSAAGDSFGSMAIDYSYEPEILGTAGAIAHAADKLGSENFVVINSDMISNIELQNAVQYHRNSGNEVTLIIMDGEQFSGYGSLYFDVDPDPILTAIGSGEGRCFHYTGVQVVNSSVVERIPKGTKSEIFKDIYPALMKDRRIGGFIHRGFWHEMGTLKEYLRTAFAILQNPLPKHLKPAGMEASAISSKASVAADASVSNTIVMEQSVIQSGSKIEGCIVGPGTVVGGEHYGEALAQGVLPWHF